MTGKVNKFNLSFENVRENISKTCTLNDNAKSFGFDLVESNFQLKNLLQTNNKRRHCFKKIKGSRKLPIKYLLFITT